MAVHSLIVIDVMCMRCVVALEFYAYVCIILMEKNNYTKSITNECFQQRRHEGDVEKKRKKKYTFDIATYKELIFKIVK